MDGGKRVKWELQINDSDRSKEVSRFAQGVKAFIGRWSVWLAPRGAASAAGQLSLFPLLELFSASHQNLWRLTFIRLLVLAAQAASVVIVYLSGWLQLPWLALFGTLGLSLALCLLTMLRLRRPWPVTELEYAIQLAFDLLVHSLLLYFSGGPANPFVSYYLVPLTIAATTLSWGYTLALSGMALLAYSLLLIWSTPIETQMVGRESLLVYGMWLSVAMAAILITFFVARMAEALRHQELLRAQRSEAGLHDQQLLAVATQAAGAAHELSTPLSTMSVLLKELRREYPQAGLQEDLALLQQQVGQCKESLQQLVRAAEAERLQPTRVRPVDRWLLEVIDRWHLMRPEVIYSYRQRSGRAPSLAVPTDLGQALLNLLNNAADANPEGIQIDLQWDQARVAVGIHDRGRGVPLAIAEQIGKPFITTKGGFGLGLFLSRASVTRVGGSVKLYNHPRGGTLTELHLPHEGWKKRGSQDRHD